MTPAMGYTKMKDSGIPWLNVIPCHWKVIKVKNLFRIKKDIAGELGYTVLSVTQQGIKPKKMDAAGQFSLDYSKYQLVDPGDYVMNHMDLLTGWVDISKQHGVTSPDYRVFSLEGGGSPDYFKYILQTCYKNKIFYGLGQGVSGFGRWRLPAETFLNFYMPVPTLSEQVIIAAYLDTQIAKIDEIIAEAKASIEDYKQWKASVIYEAVTKGLDPDVEMEESGVEWLGTIPNSWSVLSLGSLSENIRNGYVGPTRDLFFEEGVRYIQSLHVKEGKILFSKHEYYVSEEWGNLHPKVYTGDLVIVQTGDIGQVGLITPEYSGCNCHALIIVTPRKEIIFPKFEMYYFLSPVGKELLLQTKTGATLPHLNSGKIRATPVCVPPYEEQIIISDYLDERCTQIDELITEKQTLIADLESYKKSLIYEVVTGKRRVPAAAETTMVAIHPAYQKALLMCRVLDLLGDDARGRIHVQKCLFAIECLLKMPFQTQYARYQHGPYDTGITDYEALIGENDWFTVQSGSPVTYKKGAHFDAYLAEYMKVFADLDSKIKAIVEYLKPMKTAQAERVATLLAAWNDFILDGTENPTDQQIINEVMTNWTPNKANTQVSTWQTTLDKLKNSGFVPTGFGVHTIQKEVQEV